MTTRQIKVITIDGPAGTGKGTIACLLAEKLGWHYLDSGALYRVLAYSANQTGVNLDAEQELADKAMSLGVKFTFDAEGQEHVWLEGNEVTQDIRIPSVSEAASKISALQKVRSAFLECQRAFRKSPGLVTDGRDMGTVVFPDALLRFYFTASAEERAKRRYHQLKEQGIHVNLFRILRKIIERDRRDQERKVAPLKPAENAIVIDTTSLNVAEVFAKVWAEVKRKMCRINT